MFLVEQKQNYNTFLSMKLWARNHKKNFEIENFELLVTLTCSKSES
jgi:hypothetical protein